MIVAISGASGFVGRHLSRVLESAGHDVRPFVRAGAASADHAGIAWDPVSGTLDPAALRGVDAVVNLAGEPIAQRWTAARKARIHDSRVRATEAIVRAMLSAPHPRPSVLLSGSAIGFYGDRGDDVLDEQGAPGGDFLAGVAMAWERATDPVRDAGMRVVLLRTGLVLGTGGGALARMLPAFRAGVGGPMGPGRQWMSWIALEDVGRAVLFLLQAPGAAGAVNLVAPTPVRNAEFARTLGRSLGRPAILPLPSFVLALAFGEMARGALLASQRAMPKRLGELGFRCRFPVLAEALRFELERR